MKIEQPLFMILCLFLASTVHASEPTPPLTLTDGEWALVSIPSSEPDTLREVFDELEALPYSGDEGAVWTAFLYENEDDTGSGVYRSPNLDESIPAGKGFWIIQATGSDQVIEFDGSPIDDYVTLTLDTLPPENGHIWEITGSPDTSQIWPSFTYYVPVYCSVCYFDDYCTISDASDIIYDTQFSFDGESYAEHTGGVITYPWDALWSIPKDQLYINYFRTPQI